jgi:hypothetical protein
MIQIVYTNSNCSDVLTPFIKQNRKHTKLPLYLISDYDVSDLDIDGFHRYSNDEPYYKVWSDAIKKFNSETFIYLQEDFYLYSDINKEKLLEYEKFLKNSTYSFIRLLKSGQLNDKQISNKLFEIESSNEHIFSMQATLWKSNDYIKIMEAVKDPKWLENDKYRENMIKLNMNGLYHYDNERKIGKNHHDSNIYPYIATAVVRGQWNYSEYKNELEPILIENNIDPNIRGIF